MMSSCWIYQQFQIIKCLCQRQPGSRFTVQVLEGCNPYLSKTFVKMRCPHWKVWNSGVPLYTVITSNMKPLIQTSQTYSNFHLSEHCKIVTRIDLSVETHLLESNALMRVDLPDLCLPTKATETIFSFRSLATLLKATCPSISLTASAATYNGTPLINWSFHQ